MSNVPMVPGPKQRQAMCEPEARATRWRPGRGCPVDFTEATGSAASGKAEGVRGNFIVGSVIAHSSVVHRAAGRDVAPLPNAAGQPGAAFSTPAVSALSNRRAAARRNAPTLTPPA